MDDSLFRHVCESTSEVIVICDPQGKIIYCNDALEKHYHYQKSEVLGQNFNMLSPAAEDEKTQSFPQMGVGQEVMRRTKEGTRQAFFSTTTQVHDSNGKLVGISHIEHPITEHPRITNLSQQLIENAPDAMIIIDRQGDIKLANSQAERLFGYTKSEMLHQPIEFLIPNSFLDRFKSRREQMLRAPPKTMGTSADVYTKTKSGKNIPVEISLNPIETDDGQLISTTIRDVSKRKAIETQLKISEYRFRSVAENALDSIITFDCEGKILTYNKMSETIFGYPKEKILGKDLNMLFVGFDRDQLLAELTDTTKQKESDANGIRKTIFCKRRNNQQFPVEVSLGKMSIQHDPIYILITRDMSEHARLDKLKNEFVSTISHELRTPLTSIKASLDLILGGKCGQIGNQANRLLQIASRNSLRLAGLINDILDMDKIEAGKMNYNWEKIELTSLLNHVVEINQSYATNFSINLIIESFPTPIYTYADASRLTQVLTNLISNAVKFSPEGESVIIQLKSESDKITVSIKDRGPGIPDEFRSKIFHRFSQFDSSDIKVRGGTGLGLYISKLIIDQFGGYIGVLNTPGEGSTFFIELQPYHCAIQPHP